LRSNGLKIFVIYGNVVHNFITLNEIVESLSSEDYQITVQHGFSNLDLSSGNCHLFDFCDKDKFIELINDSHFVLTHAGIGSISAILNHNKMPFVVVRDHSKNEHVNNHQREFINFYSQDGIFIEVKSANDFIKYLSSSNTIPLPARKYITDLNLIRSDLFSYIDNLIHGRP